MTLLKLDKASRVALRNLRYLLKVVSKRHPSGQISEPDLLNVAQQLTATSATLERWYEGERGISGQETALSDADTGGETPAVEETESK